MTVAQHRKFDLGFNQDEASFLLPEGYVYSSKNMLYDKIGIARKRGGITGLGSTTTYNGGNLGALLTDAGSVALYSFGGSPGKVAYINATTGAFTDITPAFVNEAIADFGRPFQHHGFMMWPQFSDVVDPSNPLVTAGATGAIAGRTFSTPGSVVLTAGTPRVTCAAGDNPTTLMQVGQIIAIQHTFAAAMYIGRVIKLVSSTAFDVFPTPPSSGTANSAITFNAIMPYNAGISGLPDTGGKIGMSYQGRVVLGNICKPAGGTMQLFPRRVWFTTTLLESDPAAVPLYQGAVWLMENAYATYNWFDIPGSDPLTAMSPTGFGDAVYFSPSRAYRQTGNLSTQYGLQQSITWAVREIPNSVGCLSENSLQRTPRGIVFAHNSGVYATDGASMRPLMDKRTANDWKALQSAGSFAIYGSGLIYGNHYYICGTSGGALWGRMVNLDTLAWGPLSGKASTPASWIINSSAQDPLTPSRIWGLKWYGIGSAVSMTGGQLLKLESMFSPTSATRSDSDGTLVNLELVTRPYTEDSPGMIKLWREATVEYLNKGGANITVTPGFKLDSANLPAGGSFFYLPRQDAYTITAASNATPIVITCGAHDIKVDSWVYVSGVVGNLNANGKFRVQAVSATTVTLMGSYGSGAYVSGGTIQNVEVRDFSLIEIEEGMGAAVEYRINDTDSGGAGGADQFELYGIVHGYELRDANVE